MQVASYGVYRVDAPSFPGDDVIQLSGAGRYGADEYAGGGGIACGIFHVPGICLLRGIFADTERDVGFGEDGWGGRMADFSEIRYPFGERRDSFGDGAGVFGILESDGAAFGVFGG